MGWRSLKSGINPNIRICVSEIRSLLTVTPLTTYLSLILVIVRPAFIISLRIDRPWSVFWSSGRNQICDIFLPSYLSAWDHIKMRVLGLQSNCCCVGWFLNVLHQSQAHHCYTKVKQHYIIGLIIREPIKWIEFVMLAAAHVNRAPLFSKCCGAMSDSESNTLWSWWKGLNLIVVRCDSMRVVRYPRIERPSHWETALVLKPLPLFDINLRLNLGASRTKQLM